MSKLEEIAEIFMQYGKGIETAAAIIQNGTTPKAQIVREKVKDIYFRAQHAAVGNPAIIIIGEVVNLNTHILQNQISYRTRNSGCLIPFTFSFPFYLWLI